MKIKFVNIFVFVISAFMILPSLVVAADQPIVLPDNADTYVPNTTLMNGNLMGNTNSTFTSQSPTNSTTYGSDQNKIPNPLGNRVNSLPAFFDAIIGVMIQLGTIVSVLAIMYGGFLYVTAQGDEEKLGKAYKTLTWALVGTAILLGARTIMAAVTDTVKQLGTGI